MSSKDVPLHFRKNQLEKPDCNFDADESLKDFPLFSNKIKDTYGMPQPWGGHVTWNKEPFKFIPQPLPAAVYQIQRADHRAPDDFRHHRHERPNDDCYEYKTDSSATDVSLRLDNERRQTQPLGGHKYTSGQEGVLCDICQQAAAVKTCLTCMCSYCGFHVREHYTVEALERHQLVDVTENCCPHYQKSLDFFCRTDQMRICSICVQGAHSGHEIISNQSVGVAVLGLPDKVVPPPGEITFLSVKPTSVILSWGSPEEPEAPQSFRVKWSSTKKEEGCFVIRGFQKIEIESLQLGQLYYFSVATQDEDGSLSKAVTASVFTAVPPPRHLRKIHVEATALCLDWTEGNDMEGIQHRFILTVTSEGKESLVIYTQDCNKTISDLEPDTKYKISVCTVLNDRHSEAVSTFVHTEPSLREVLSMLGLEDQYDNKLTRSSVMEINQNDTSENQLDTPKSLPEAFLRRLMMLNTSARSLKCASYDVDTGRSNAINPLDLITALFLCSDGILQQDIVLKMTLCQFAVPLLLPNCEKREITMMLWSLRDIVRTFRPPQQAFLKQSCEERLVSSRVPLVSFVRLGKRFLSKSQMLNKLLSNSQHSHDTFYHCNMVCGDVPRRISDGLVEMSWYLPCGDRNVDKFTEPLAVANLRGDIKAFDKQFSFLCQTSAAVYIFCDESEMDFFKNLQKKQGTAEFFLISRTQGKHFTLKMVTMEPSLKIADVSQTKKTDTELLKVLKESISKLLEGRPNKMSVANLAEGAHHCDILIDEESDNCQSAWNNANNITERVKTTSEFKDKHLPSQGHIWKALSWVETEHWRLRKVGKENTENYRKSLKTKEKQLRGKQQIFEIPAGMVSFIHGMVTSEVQRYYFLKWLEIKLDNVCRHQLSALQDQYQELSQKSPKDTEKIAELDKQISVCSLRMEHFFRECGQLYECASYLPEYTRQRKTTEQLPALCAQMLLDGFPLEFVDGDAANIPMKWTAAVLTELHHILHSKTKLKVITVIGAENSGKSTLLNTMFGLRFAVSKGTCTRGAFMQLISINSKVRKELGCDCILIIDTEGLKPHPMAQDDHSHERDKEVASLAVALSDVAVVSVSNSREEDILELVLHAFTRLKDLGKKPLCHFVHINTPAVSAAERKKRDKELVEQLEEMIQNDDEMKKADIAELSDVMQFNINNCNWYIPPVWHGVPPMAPVSVGYSEKALALKKQLIKDLKKCPKRGDMMDFIEWVDRFWKAL
ncbi:up-regulator of cell proliferation-like isoform X3 [Amphiprion ocellaris]|nr:up-regulator of cell proliferation-like isoform X3 [Amphiprion ocellaris]XP_054866167.1 up-regulator of cell proliferation-like isoform X3 [Amphiprion ocellaris]XP_054866168.1 up-regulator of cell proliferation-like isoform X3 [Amphiprion ocellaris]